MYKSDYVRRDIYFTGFNGVKTFSKQYQDSPYKRTIGYTSRYHICQSEIPDFLYAHNLYYLSIVLQPFVILTEDP